MKPYNAQKTNCNRVDNFLGCLYHATPRKSEKISRNDISLESRNDLRAPAMKIARIANHTFISKGAINPFSVTCEEIGTNQIMGTIWKKNMIIQFVKVNVTFESRFQRDCYYWLISEKGKNLSKKFVSFIEFWTPSRADLTNLLSEYCVNGLYY